MKSYNHVTSMLELNMLQVSIGHSRSREAHVQTSMPSLTTQRGLSKARLRGPFQGDECRLPNLLSSSQSHLEVTGLKRYSPRARMGGDPQERYKHQVDIFLC